MQLLLISHRFLIQAGAPGPLATAWCHVMELSTGQRPASAGGPGSTTSARSPRCQTSTRRRLRVPVQQREDDRPRPQRLRAAINDNGVIVGGDQIYHGGTLQNHNNLIPAGSPYQTQYANAINDNGQIAHDTATYQAHAPPLTPNDDAAQISLAVSPVAARETSHVKPHQTARSPAPGGPDDWP